jgi:ribosomal protein S14
MKHLTLQITTRHEFTISNRLPQLRSRKYRLTHLRYTPYKGELEGSSIEKAAGVLRWLVTSNWHAENRVSPRASCLLTGRNRSAGGRYGIARTKIKAIANEGNLFGVRKSS